MTNTLIAYVFAVFFLSAFLKGITGLGFSTICIGLLASVIDLKIAIPLLIVPSLSSNVLVMVDAGRFHQALRRFWPVYLSVIPGVLLGLWALDAVDSTSARSVLGVVLAGYGIWGLMYTGWRLPAGLERPLAPAVGVSAGIVNGLTGSQVIPMLPYLMALDLERNLFVQTINIFFTSASLVMLVGLGKLGMLNQELAVLSIAGIVPVAIGIWAGGRLRRRLSDTRFRTAVLSLLIVLGCALVAASFR